MRVTPSLTGSRPELPQDPGGGLEIDLAGGAARRDLLVDAPLLDIPVLVDMGRSPDLVIVTDVMRQREQRSDHPLTSWYRTRCPPRKCNGSVTPFQD